MFYSVVIRVVPRSDGFRPSKDPSSLSGEGFFYLKVQVIPGQYQWLLPTSTITEPQYVYRKEARDGIENSESLDSG